MKTLWRWLDETIFGLGRDFRVSYLPPLMVYLAAGMAGLTAVVGTFFIKDYLGFSAAFLVSLSFWIGIPWALKMPLGHVVDLIWHRKEALVYLGAVLIAASLAIMIGLLTQRDLMAEFASAETWFVVSALLSPIGYVIQDVVADAMTVEAVPKTDLAGVAYSEAEMKAMHTTMQTLGRIAIISGLILVAALNIFMFRDVENLTQAEQIDVYAQVYSIACVIPVLSIAGVLLGRFLLHRRETILRSEGVPEERIADLVFRSNHKTEPNYWILVGGLLFAAVTLSVGITGMPYAQETVFATSMGIVLFLMRKLLDEIPAEAARALVGTAVIIFVFRAVPLPGPGATWFEIDVLGFDQRFLAILGLITSCLTLVGMIVLRPMLARRPIALIVGLLTVAVGFLALPNLGLYYGLHHWTSALTNGVVDARFIALIDTAIESPLGQIAMIPMLAWIARTAPPHLKATFFAVMASFTNLALSASSLATRYLNEVFVVTREIRDHVTGALEVAANYDSLGLLLITVTLLSVALPLLTIGIVQISPYRTSQ